MLKSIFIAAAATLFATTAFAHVTLEQGEARVGAGYKAVFRVPHGCAGSTTTAIRVQIPEGYVGVKPMPKPGWTLHMLKGKYAKTYKPYGHAISEGITEIDWTGGNLPDDNYDEFVMSGYLADSLPTGEKLYFPVVQECEKGVNRWIEKPAEGADPDSVEHPAPAVKLLPKN
ncbi:MAG: YcnI family copper-binding membrane protein [Rhizobiaceae bacterium]